MEPSGSSGSTDAGRRDHKAENAAFELTMESQEFAESAIYKAIVDLDAGAVLRALYGGDNAELRDEAFRTSYLHHVVLTAEVASQDRLEPVVYQLSNAGLDPDARDYKGRTALDIAAYKGLARLVQALIRVGADPAAKDHRVRSGLKGSAEDQQLADVLARYSPGLRAAVRDGNTGMVIILVNSWCRVNARGDNLLESARGEGKPADLVATLEDYHVTLEFVHATLAGDARRMLEFLMDSKPCDTRIMDISHQEAWTAPLSPRSLRDTAAAMGHSHVLSLLPDLTAPADTDGVVAVHSDVTNDVIIPGGPLRLSRYQQQQQQAGRYLGKRPAPTTRDPPLRADRDDDDGDDDNDDTRSTGDTHRNRNPRRGDIPKLALDFLNDSADGERPFGYEQSKFTGSVAIRHKNKSRKRIPEMNQVTDDSLMWPEPAILGQSPGESPYSNLDHIATPRKAGGLGRDHHSDYSKNWAEHARQFAPHKSAKVKAVTKEIKSKLCVIS